MQAVAKEVYYQPEIITIKKGPNHRVEKSFGDPDFIAPHPAHAKNPSNQYFYDSQLTFANHHAQQPSIDFYGEGEPVPQLGTSSSKEYLQAIRQLHD